MNIRTTAALVAALAALAACSQTPNYEAGSRQVAAIIAAEAK